MHLRWQCAQLLTISKKKRNSGAFLTSSGVFLRTCASLFDTLLPNIGNVIWSNVNTGTVKPLPTYITRDHHLVVLLRHFTVTIQVNDVMMSRRSRYTFRLLLQFLWEQRQLSSSTTHIHCHSPSSLPVVVQTLSVFSEKILRNRSIFVNLEEEWAC